MKYGILIILSGLKIADETKLRNSIGKVNDQIDGKNWEILVLGDIKGIT